MPAAMAALAVLLLAPAMGLYGRWPWARRLAAPALGCRCRRQSAGAAGLWALSEWVRGWLFTGFPWLSSGYAHNHSPLAGFAPVIGMYGLGWLAATLGRRCCCCCTARAARGRLAVAAWPAAACFLQWTYPEGKPIRCACCKGMCRRTRFNGAQVPPPSTVPGRHHGRPGRPDRHAGNRHRHAAAELPPDYLPASPNS
jgi:apolipoprotein N-acyltransferase